MSNHNTDFSDLVFSIESEFKNKSMRKALTNVQAEIAEEVERFKRLEAQFNSELKDVKNLQVASLQNFLATIKRTKGDILQQEEAELLRAKLKLNACQEFLEELRQDERKLKTSIYRLEESQKSKLALGDKKPIQLTADQQQIAETISQHLAYLNQVNESLSQAKRVQISMQKVQDSLSQLTNFTPRISDYILLNSVEQSAKSALEGLTLFNKGMAVLEQPKIVTAFVLRLTQISDYLDLTRTSGQNRNKKALLDKNVRNSKKDCLDILELIADRIHTLESLKASTEAKSESFETKWNLHRKIK